MTLFRLRRALSACAALLIILLASAILCRWVLSYLFAPRGEAPTFYAQPKQETTQSITVLNLPLTVPISDLQAAAERYTPKTYTDVDEDFTDMLLDDSLSYELTRGPISMALKGDGIALSFPVSGVVRAKGDLNFGVRVSTSAHADVAGIISGRIAFKILPDWRIEPVIDYRVKITKALIPFKGMGDISLRSFLEDKLSEKIQKRKHKLTRKIMSKEIIRKEVAEVWKKMHRVEKISEDPLVWARVIPKKVGFLPVTATGGDSLSLGVSLSLETFLCLADAPPPIAFSELPDAEILKTLDDRFRLTVPVSANMTALNRFIGKQIETRTLPLGKYFRLSAGRADLVSPGGNRLSAIIFAHIGHDLPGLSTDVRLYVHGRVDYEPEKGTIRYSDISYDAVFSRPLVKALHWVAYPYLRHRLEEALTYSMNRDVEKAHAAINQWIETLIVPPGVNPELSVNPPELFSLVVDRDGIAAVVSLNGRIKATLTLPDKDTEKPTQRQ